MDHPVPTHESAPPAHSHGAQDYAHVAAHVRKYITIGIFQVIMTAVTVWASRFDFGSSKINITLTLLAALFNAAMVAAYSMHLKEEKPIIFRFLFFTAVFFAILFGLTLLYWSSPIMGSTHTHH